MNNKFKEYKGLDLSQINKDVLAKWEKEHTFEKSMANSEGKPEFIFFEGPPSANGMPGIHHVISRTLKDTFCRYKTLKGFIVKRKAGWDTHGLPVELSVEKKLGITKEDIGTKISVEDYNKTCRQEVMKYTRQWEDITKKIGYWLDMESPYITYDNKYIETLWWLLKKLYEKGYLYKGYTIQPYSPAAGTGLSTHELNQPGCYRDVKDTTCTAQFKIVKNQKSEFLFQNTESDLYFLAWTTTPWTLPSNTALAVGANITYQKIKTFNPYTGLPVTVILAKDLTNAYFNKENESLDFTAYQAGDKKIPYQVIDQYQGKDLQGIAYEQLIPFMQPEGKAFEVILGDFVTTEDGTGIVHIAPTFGADDDKVAKLAGIAPMLLIDKNNKAQPMVDKQGRLFKIQDISTEFVKKHVNTSLYNEFEGRYVKNAYDPDANPEDNTLDIDLSVWLKKENKAFKIEKHSHSYPHCWRTDKPILYYPLDSWFIKSTAAKEQMIALNKTINWQPPSTGEGRFGQWLENLIDWNLSRSRFWGTPLPIWRTENGEEELCIGSLEELKAEINKSVEAGFMSQNPLDTFIPDDFSKENYSRFDMHRPYVDEIILVSPSGKKMKRESDLIDVWFDSGAMPYAQLHYPFENKDKLQSAFPADYIAEGVDQTRGWFFTLHALSTMLFDSVAYKNIIATGLLLDKNGIKMSKRLGNVIDPFQTIEDHGSDPVRWYMLTNSRPWDNLKFDLAGVEEVKRKFFGTLYNTYAFFALYANLDNFTYAEPEIPLEERPEIDRWIISLLHTLIKEVELSLENYEPTSAGRLIQTFVSDHLSNWYVRLNRKRFWGQEYNKDKIAAFQTLYTCLEVTARLISPIAPFYAEQLFADLNHVSQKHQESVHLSGFPQSLPACIDQTLEERMRLAQEISSLVLSLRRKSKIKVRQPLQKIMLPALNDDFCEKIESVRSIILSEINVKELEFLKDDTTIINKKIKPDFKILGKKYGKDMKTVAAKLAQLTTKDIGLFEQKGFFEFEANEQLFKILLNEVQIIAQDIPGLLTAVRGEITVALDTQITPVLKNEGIAREIVNKIQNIRKESGFEVSDKINLIIEDVEEISPAIKTHETYIKTQVLAESILLEKQADFPDAIEVEKKSLRINIQKI